MSSHPGIQASIRQRLLNRARITGEEFQRMLTRYAIERLLYRLTQSPHRDRFVLKGAMLFSVWSEAPLRPTGDVDLLGFGTAEPDALRGIFAEICAAQAPDDGLVFERSTIAAEMTRPEQEYKGAHIRLDARLGTAVIPVQIDIGFGDIIHPAPSQVTFPQLIEDVPPAVIRAYPPETVVAEKFEAMTRFGETTSRLKDFYDVWAIAQMFSFEMETLATAIKGTFEKRGTRLPNSQLAVLSDRFADHPLKQRQWAAFIRRSPPAVQPPVFLEVLRELRRFLFPVLLYLAGSETKGRWRSDVGWSD